MQAPVRFRGVEVGKVETIEFLPNDARVILVRVAVRAGTPITKGTYAQLGSQGVTGLAYVILDDDGSKPERVAAGDLSYHIPVRASFLDEIAGSGKELLVGREAGGGAGQRAPRRQEPGAAACAPWPAWRGRRTA